MQLNFIAINNVLYQEKVTSVTVPGYGGELTILPHHIPLIAPLSKGKVRLKDREGKEHFFDIGGGVLEVNHSEVNILVSSL